MFFLVHQLEVLKVMRVDQLTNISRVLCMKKLETIYLGGKIAPKGFRMRSILSYNIRPICYSPRSGPTFVFYNILRIEI